MQKKEGSTYKKMNQEITMRLGKIVKTNSSFYLKNYTFVASTIHSVKNVFCSISVTIQRPACLSIIRHLNVIQELFISSLGNQQALYI